MSEGAVIATAPAAGADERGDGRAALHPSPAGAARRDLARPLRGALRRRGRAAARDRGRPPPRRRGRPGLVAGRDRHRRRARHAPARVEAGDASGRREAARRGRRCSACSRSCSASRRASSIAFVALLVLSGADSVSVFIRATLVPLVTPNEMRGRVLAVENVFIGASNELGAFESGVVGQLFGTVPAVVLGGAATLAVAGDLVEGVPRAREGRSLPGRRDAVVARLGLAGIGVAPPVRMLRCVDSSCSPPSSPGSSGSRCVGRCRLRHHGTDLDPRHRHRRAQHRRGRGGPHQGRRAARAVAQAGRPVAGGDPAHADQHDRRRRHDDHRDQRLRVGREPRRGRAARRQHAHLLRRPHRRRAVVATVCRARSPRPVPRHPRGR